MAPVVNTTGRVGRPTPVGLAESVRDLSPAEQRVARFLVDGGPEALVLSAADIAQALGTSDATVVRTAQALGYPGLRELRRALAGRQAEPPEVTLAQRLHQTLADTPGDEILATALADHAAALDTLARQVSSTQFTEAVDVLDAGARVVWRGVGPSAYLADYARLLCQRMGRPSAVLTETGTSFADELLGLRADDAVAVLAYGRLQAHVRVLLDQAEQVGAPVVLITDAAGRRVQDRVAVVLESGRGVPGLFASHSPTLVLLEALVLGLAARRQGEAEAQLARLNDLRADLAGRRLDVDRP